MAFATSYGPRMFKSAARRCNITVNIPRLSRNESTALHFYQNKQLELYALKQARRLSLRQLVFFGRSMDEDRLIKSANYVRTELPVRIAHRIRDLQALPYIVVTQEGVARVYELYWTAFEKFRRYPPVTTLAENDKFCEFLSLLLNEHAIVIPNLSLGMSLSSPHIPAEKLDNFMHRMLVSRISRRVLAEHHISLSEIHAGKHDESRASGEPHIGIIFTDLNVKRSIERCARLLRERPVCVDEDFGDEGVRIIKERGWPEVVVDGHTEVKFAYIREQLEYIVFELLKNSMSATVLKHLERPSLPPVRVTIVAGADDVGIRISDQGGGLLTPQNQIKMPSDLFSFSHVRNAARLEHSRLGALRTVSLSPHGMHATVNEQVERWQNASGSSGGDARQTPEKEAGVTSGPRPRLGIGLPMSNIFATYFGGSLELVSLDGWGTDVYLRLPKLGTNLEGIEV